jgi:thiamine-monophosphate kinase
VNDDMRLDELGESWIIDNVLAPRYQESGPGSFGDDSAVILDSFEGKRGSLVATVDPCPPPAALELGYTDKYLWGWLSVVINLSDLAAGGARPLALLSSLELPPDMTLREFRRLLEGIDDAAADSGTYVVGGNIKEASRLNITITALGLSSNRVLSRSGARLGDRLISVGPLGQFWAQFLDARDGLLDQPDAVLYPVPQLKAGLILSEDMDVHACMDNSDGLAASVELLAKANGFGAIIDSQSFTFADEVVSSAARRGVTPIHFALGWGDWNLVCAVEPTSVTRVIDGLSDAGIHASEIGWLVSVSEVVLRIGGQEILVPSPRSERLTRDSWMSAGLKGYIDQLLSWAPPT